MTNEVMERSQKWLRESMDIVDEMIAKGPPFNFNGPPSMCVSMIEGAPGLGIELLKKIAETGDEQSLVFLGEIYLDGKIRLRDGVLAEKNPELGKAYLTKAVELGSTTAMLKLMGDHYVEDGVLKYRDPENAMYWLKRAADAGCESANEGWADHLVNGRSAQDCTQEEIDEIERYYQNAHYASPSYYKLARFHSDGLSSTDYTGDEYSRARYWLRMGVRDSSHNCNKEPCKKMLAEWGTEKPESTKESSSSGMIVLQIIAGAIGLALFATLGTFFIAAAGSIMAFTVPALIIGYIVYKLIAAISSKG